MTLPSTPIKALSLHPVWASHIVAGRKTIEIRSKPTRYRGPLLICSSLKPRHPGTPGGHALALTSIIDCRPMLLTDTQAAAGVPHNPNAYAWILGPVTPLTTPFKVKGALSFFTVTPPANPSRQTVEPLLFSPAR